MRVGIGGTPCDAQVAHRPQRRVQLHTACRDVARIGEARDDHARDQIRIVRLKILIFGVECGEVERQLAAEQRVLQADLIGIGRFRRDHIGAGRGQIVEHVERRALIAARIGRIRGRAVRNVVLHTRLARQILVGRFRAERHAVGRAHRLRCRSRRRDADPNQPDIFVIHALIEIGVDPRPRERGGARMEHIELIDGVAQAPDQAETIADVKRALPEQRDILEHRAEIGGAGREGRGVGRRARARRQRGRCRRYRCGAHLIVAREHPLARGARIIGPEHIGEELMPRRGQPDFLAERVAGLRPEIVELVETDIGRGQEIAVADLGIFVVAIGGDRRDRLRARLDVGLEREAVAGLLGPRRQILREFAGVGAAWRWQRCCRRIGGHRSRCGVDRPGRDHFTAAIVIVAVIIGDEGELHIGSGIGIDLQAPAIMFEAVDQLASGDVADVAVIIGVEAGQARAHILAQRHINRGACAIFAVAEEPVLDIAAKRARRLFRDDVDDAGARIFAEQRALRPTQHFDLVDIDQVAKRLARAAVDHAVDHGRNRWLARDREGRGADPAQEQRLVERRARFQEIERRHQILRALQAGLALRGDRIAGHHGDGERHVLQPFGALLRGDDDVPGRVLGRRRGRRGLRETRCG
ncbi:hypothetical protein D9M73_107350 [compost metagenome]